MHIHKWSKWVVIEEGDIVRSGTSFIVGKYYIQRKDCKKCEKIKLRTIKS